MMRRGIAEGFAVVGLWFFPSTAPAQDTNPTAPSTAPGADVPLADKLGAVFDEDFSPHGPYTVSRFTSENANFPFLRPSFDALQTTFGLLLAPADDTLRAQLKIPAGHGVVITAIKPGSLAEHAGLKASDVLISLGDQDALNVPQTKKILLGLGKEALEIKLIRGGKPSRMSLVGPDHGFPPEAAEYWIGVPVSPVDATLHVHLPMLASDAGLIVNDVVKDSPADKAGVRKNDILMAMGGKSLKTPDTMIEQIQAAQGKPVPLEVLRAGKPTTLTITPAKRAHPTTINVVPRPNIAYRVVQPNLGVEIDPRMPPKSYGEDITRNYLSIIKKLNQQPMDVQVFMQPPPEKGPDATARIEAQLKEMSAKLEEVRKAVEGLRKPEAK